MFEEFGFVDDFEEAERSGSNILAKNDDDSCIYLKDGKCSIHNERPQVCRKFFCDSTDERFKGMVEKIRSAKGC